MMKDRTGRRGVGVASLGGRLLAPVVLTLAAVTPALGQGQLVVWGNGPGLSQVPPAPTGLEYVSVGADIDFAYALLSDGTVVSWGPGAAPGLPAPPKGLAYTKIAVSARGAYGLRDDGEILAVPFFDYLPPPLPVGVMYTSLAAADLTADFGGGGFGTVVSFHGAAVRSDGQIAVWSSNTGSEFDVTPLPDGVVYISVAVGVTPGSSTSSHGHFLALRSDGRVVGWGSNQQGHLDIPELPVGMSYTHISTNVTQSLALRSDGQLLSWGPFADLHPVPDLPPGIVYTAAAAGAFAHVALRSDGQVVAWGLDTNGQLNVPDAPAGHRYTSVYSGYRVSFAIATPLDCPADLNGDGKLNFFDIQTFLAAFAVQQPPSDWNADGIFNFFDLHAYLAAFNAGCP